MIKAKFHTKSGEPAGDVELPEAVFGIEPNTAVLWQYIKAYRANQRRGTHSAKRRSDVRGGGKKPWRQKGTGRARQGTRTSPLWKGGGVTFAPKQRDYRIVLPKKMRRLALASALSDRAKENMVYIFEEFEVSQPKTKAVVEILNNAEIDTKRPILIITNSVKRDVVIGSRNIDRLQVTHMGELNPYQVLCAEKIIIEQEALNKIEELYNK